MPVRAEMEHWQEGMYAIWHVLLEKVQEKDAMESHEDWLGLRLWVVVFHHCVDVIFYSSSEILACVMVSRCVRWMYVSVQIDRE